MNRQLIRSRQFDADLAGIWTYIAEHNREAADRLVRDIDRTLQQLAENPELGFQVETSGGTFMCKPVRRNYLIFYRATDARVDLLRILHGARNLDSLL
jgi:toxin ParE1/3/4